MPRPQIMWSEAAACAWIATRSRDIADDAEELADQLETDWHPWQRHAAKLREKVPEIDGRFSRTAVLRAWKPRRGQPRQLKRHLAEALWVASYILNNDRTLPDGKPFDQHTIARELGLADAVKGNATGRYFRTIWPLAIRQAEGMLEVAEDDPENYDAADIRELRARLETWKRPLRARWNENHD